MRAPDSLMTPHKQCGDVLHFTCCFFKKKKKTFDAGLHVIGTEWNTYSGIQWLCEFKKFESLLILREDRVVSSKRVTLQLLDVKVQNSTRKSFSHHGTVDASLCSSSLPGRAREFISPFFQCSRSPERGSVWYLQGSRSERARVGVRAARSAGLAGRQRRLCAAAGEMGQTRTRHDGRQKKRGKKKKTTPPDSRSIVPIC